MQEGLRSLATALVLVSLWRAACVVFAIPAFILPSPDRVASMLVARAGFLAGHAALTLAEMLLGLLVGAALGVGAGLLLASLPPVRRALLPLLLVAQALPVFAIAPLLVTWFGYGLLSKVVMASLIIFFPIASAFYDGLRQTPRPWLDLARLNGANRWRSLMLIRVPSALPSLVSGLRVAAAVAPIGAVVGEWVGSSAGLGFVMLHANARMQTDLVFAALVVLAVMVLMLRAAIEALGRRLIPWVPVTA